MPAVKSAIEGVDLDYVTGFRRLMQLAALAKAGNRHAALAGLLDVAEHGLRDLNPISRGRPRDPRDLSLAELGLSEKTIGYLELPARDWPGVIYAGELVKWSADEVAAIGGVGPVALEEVRRALAAVRLHLRGDSLPYLPIRSVFSRDSTRKTKKNAN